MSKRRRQHPAKQNTTIESGFAELAPSWSGEAFAEFELRLENQLETLVARWIGVAAPAPSGIRRILVSHGHSHSEPS
jgi:hypothetical protein